MGFTTRRSYAAVASSLLAFTLSAGFADAADLKAMTYKGCYSSSTPLEDQGSYQYQTNGYCQPICVGKNQAVLALSKGSDCWCGGQLPVASSKVDESKCNTPCNGFGDQMCGGSNYFSVYLTGTSSDVTEYNGKAVSSSGNGDPSATSATPSVITSISPGTTFVVTQLATASASASSNNSSGGGTSTAGVAAGVVVGIVGAAAIAGGIFFLLRRRRRQRAEEDYKRSAQVSDFMSNASDRRPPNTAYSQMSDSRLDPEHGKRNSVGSIQDEHDFSRRILRVANPDSH